MEFSNPMISLFSSLFSTSSETESVIQKEKISPITNDSDTYVSKSTVLLLYSKLCKYEQSHVRWSIGHSLGSKKESKKYYLDFVKHHTKNLHRLIGSDFSDPHKKTTYTNSEVIQEIVHLCVSYAHGVENIFV